MEQKTWTDIEIDINLYACIRLHYALIFQKWTGEIKEASIKMQDF